MKLVICMITLFLTAQSFASFEMCQNPEFCRALDERLHIKSPSWEVTTMLESIDIYELYRSGEEKDAISFIRDHLDSSFSFKGKTYEKDSIVDALEILLSSFNLMINKNTNLSQVRCARTSIVFGVGGGEGHCTITTLHVVSDQIVVQTVPAKIYYGTIGALVDVKLLAPERRIFTDIDENLFISEISGGSLSGLATASFLIGTTLKAGGGVTSGELKLDGESSLYPGLTWGFGAGVEYSHLIQDEYQANTFVVSADKIADMMSLVNSYVASKDDNNSK